MVNKNLLIIVAGTLLSLAVFGVTMDQLMSGESVVTAESVETTDTSDTSDTSDNAEPVDASESVQASTPADTASMNTERQTVFAWHFVLKPMPMEDAQRMVDVAQSAGFNTVVVQLANGLALDSFPMTPGENAWDKVAFLEWIEYARSRGMNVIPEIKLLSKQKKFLQKSRPRLMFNAATYDPRNEKVYKIAFRLIDELISIMQPTAIHIGHDEVAGFRPYSARKYLKRGEEMVPADLFLKDVLTVHDYLKSRNVETWMWGDMLISEEEFPEIPKNSLHGSKPGYGKTLRDQLPRDIVICDWHYKQDETIFPTLAVMQGEGFRVIGATFHKENTIRNFSKYAAQHAAYGMMATSWANVHQRKWAEVDRIITFSGETFQKDFLDSK
jgi:hypothetical protein